MASSIRALGQGYRVLMAAANSSTTTTATAPKRGRPAGILKVVPVSQPLGEFLGVPEVSRTDAVKKVWEYIKHNNLQRKTEEYPGCPPSARYEQMPTGNMHSCIDNYNSIACIHLCILSRWMAPRMFISFFQNPLNKKEILCDAKLKTIFNGKEQVGFLEIAKLLSQHFVKSS